MPTARDSLLNAALGALEDRPWDTVRMVEVAASAGVSRQTLYNEFGGKDGLAHALVRRAVDDYLAGVEHALAAAERRGADAGECLAAAAAWTLHAARRSALLRGALTGCRGRRLPSAPDPSPGDLVEALRGRAADVLEQCCPRCGAADIGRACDAAVRLTLSYVLVPAPSDEDACLEVSRLVRGLLNAAAA